MPEQSRRAAFLVAADQLEAWAASLPRWSPKSEETWYAFAERRFQAETALMARLRRAPQCELEVCPMREHVRLALGGLRVSSERGLAEALRAWAKLARARWGEMAAAQEEVGA